MKIEIYDSLLKYLNDKIIPKSVREASSTYAAKNYRAMAASFMVKEGSIYKVRIQSALQRITANNFTKCYSQV